MAVEPQHRGGCSRSGAREVAPRPLSADRRGPARGSRRLWWLAPGRPIDGFWLALFVLLELGAHLGARDARARAGRRGSSSCPASRWSARGPYRFVDHPNYLVVVARDRGAAAGVRPVAGRAALHRCSTPRSSPSASAPRTARSAAKLRLRLSRSAPISRLSPRHRQMPEAGAPRLRSERRLGFDRSVT